MICQHCHLHPLKKISRNQHEPDKPFTRFERRQAEYLVTMINESDQVIFQARVCHEHKQRIVRDIAPVESPDDGGLDKKVYFNPVDQRFRVVVVAYSAKSEGEEGAA